MERGRPGEGGVSFTFIGGSYPEIYSTRGGSPFQASCEETQSCLGLDLPSSQHVTIPPHGSENKCETSNNPVGLNRRWVTAFIKVSSRRPHTQDDPARGVATRRAPGESFPYWPLTRGAAGGAAGWSDIQNGITCFQGTESSGGKYVLICVFAWDGVPIPLLGGKQADPLLTRKQETEVVPS